jgi:hypothetical protein
MLFFLSRIVAALRVVAVQCAEPPWPKIVWLFVDDMSADFGCYG